MSLHCLLHISDFHLLPRKENFVGIRKYGMVGEIQDMGKEGKGKSLGQVENGEERCERENLEEGYLQGRRWRKVRGES